MIKLRAFISCLLMSFALISPTLALADFSTLSVTGNPLTAATTPYLMLTGLTGQSACSITVGGTFGGSIAVEGLYPNTTNSQWTAPLTVYTPDGTTTTGTTITAAGSYIFNCGTMLQVRADGTATTGTPTVTLNASGGVNVIAHIPNGGGGGGSVTAVTATGPIASSGGTTPNITCTTCVTAVTGSGNIASSGGTTPNITVTGVIPISNGGTGSGTQNFVDLTTNQTIAGIKTFSSAPVLSGASITSATIPDASLVTAPVTAVTATGPIVSSGGTTPNITCPTCGTGNGTVTSVTSANNLISVATGTTTPVLTANETPTFTGTVTVPNLIDSGLGASLPVCTTGASQLATTGCATGTVTSVTGTANQISVATGTTTPVLSIPTNFVAPGSITSTTTMTSTGLFTTDYGDEILNTGGGYTNLIGPGGYGTGVFCSSPCNQQQATGWSDNISGVGSFIGSDSTKTTQGIANTYFQFGVNNNGTVTINTALDNLGDLGTAGSLTSGSLTASTCLGASATKVITSSSNCTTSVTGTANQITVTGTTTPVLSITTNPTIPGAVSVTGSLSTPVLTDTGLGASQCIRVNGSQVLSSKPYCNPVTTASFVIPAVGSTVSTTVDTNLSTYAGEPFTVSDGTNTMNANSNANTTTSMTLVLKNQGMTMGAVGNTMASGAVENFGSATLNAVVPTAPTQQVFLTGSGTYTTPAGVKWIQIEAVGGGGGGGGSGTTTTGGTGGTGGNTTFGTTLIAANGGVGGTDGDTSPFMGGAGGTASLGSGPLGIAVSGGGGSPSAGVTGGASSGSGGNSCLGGGGAGAQNGGSAGLAGATNTGGGGSGSSASGGTASNGGGGGGCVQATINAPAATYAYAVGAAGTAGTAGTVGLAGSAGGSGIIQVIEHYNY